jgi:hypothetical protein
MSALGQKRTHALQQTASLFDYLVGAQQEFGGLEIDDKFELGWLLDWKIAGFGPAQNLVDIVTGSPEQVRKAGSIGHQTTFFDHRSLIEHGRKLFTHSERIDVELLICQERSQDRIATDIKSIGSAFNVTKGRGSIFCPPDFDGDDFEAQWCEPLPRCRTSPAHCPNCRDWL